MSSLFVNNDISKNKEYKTAAVCFISDTSACSDNQFGGSGDSDFGFSNKERCFNEGYTISECAEGYVWKDGACAVTQATWGQCSGYAENCALGDILFSDGTCSANTAKIIAAGDKSEYPAAWAAHEYKTAGTEAGDWCLPAAGIFTSYYNNRDAINRGFSQAGGVQFTNSTYVWSSSEYDMTIAWLSSFSLSDGLARENKTYTNEVHPVIEF